MKNSTVWVFGSVDHASSSIRYHIGCDGSYHSGDIQDAMKFNSFSELVEYLSKHWQLQSGAIIREVSNVTLEKLEKDLAENNMTLYHLLHNPCKVS